MGVSSVVVFLVVTVVCLGVTDAHPHGHVLRLSKSLRYGGGGNASPTAIDNQQITSYNGGGSAYNSGGSAYNSGGSAYNSGGSAYKSGGSAYNNGGSTYSGGESTYDGGESSYKGGESSYKGGESSYKGSESSYKGGESFSSSGGYASSNSGSYGSSASGNYEGVVAIPFGLGINTGEGMVEGSAAAYSDTGSVGGSYQQAVPISYDADTYSLGGADTGTGIGIGAGEVAGVGFGIELAMNNQYDQKQNDGAYFNNGAYGQQQSQGAINTGAASGTSFGLSMEGDNKKSGGHLVPTKIEVPQNSGQIGATGSVSLGGGFENGGAYDNGGVISFGTVDSEYDRGFQTVVQSSNAPKNVPAIKPDPKFPQTSYGFVPEGQVNTNVGVVVGGTNYNKNTLPNVQITTTKPQVNVGSYKPQQHEMTITFGTTNTKTNKQPVGGGSGIGIVASAPHVDTTGSSGTKYSGSFGGGPGVLGDQKSPGFAVTGSATTVGATGHSHQTNNDFAHNQGQVNSGPTPVTSTGTHSHAGGNVGVDFSGQNSGHYNNADSTKFTGTFGGGPGILGDQKPEGYAVNKGVTAGSHSQGPTNTGMTSVIGIQFGGSGGGYTGNPVHTSTHTQQASGGGKYTGSFGGGPGVLGDQRPPGFAVTGNAATVGASGSQNHQSHHNAGTVAVSHNQVHTDTEAHDNTGKYTGSFGGGPGVLGDQRPPGFAVTGSVGVGSNVADQKGHNTVSGHVPHSGSAHLGSAATYQNGAENHHGSLNSNTQHSQDSHVSASNNYGGSTSGSAGNPSGFEIGIHGNLLGGLASSMMNGIKSAAAAGSQALSSSHVGVSAEMSSSNGASAGGSTKGHCEAGK